MLDRGGTAPSFDELSSIVYAFLRSSIKSAVNHLFSEFTQQAKYRMKKNAKTQSGISALGPFYELYIFNLNSRRNAYC